MSLETWKMSDPDNEARLLGYWIVHIGHGFVLHRFDEPRVCGEWFSTEKDLRARLVEVATFPRHKQPMPQRQERQVTKRCDRAAM
jgi:hypothetical protein